MTVIWANRQRQNVPSFLLKPAEIGAGLSVVFRGWGWTAESLRLQAAPPATSRLLNSGGLLGWTDQGFGRFPCLWGSVSQGHVIGTQKRDTNQQIFLDCRVQMPRGNPMPSLAIQLWSKPVSHSRRHSQKPSWAYETTCAGEQVWVWHAAGERGASAMVHLGYALPHHRRS